LPFCLITIEKNPKESYFSPKAHLTAIKNIFLAASAAKQI